MEIKRHDSEVGRFYEVEEGVFLPSSTTILEAYPLAYGMREFLQANTKAEAEQIKNEAAIRGSKIHHTIELLLKGEKVVPSGITQDQVKLLGLSDKKLVSYLKEPFSKKEDKMVKGFMKFWEDFKVELVENELTVYSKKFGFAGTLDFVGYIHVPQRVKNSAEVKKSAKNTPIHYRKQLVLLDFKTGKGLYDEYDLQIASYWQAYHEGSKARKQMKIGLLQLGVNKCGYKLKIVEKPRNKFLDFLAIKKVWDMVNPEAKPDMYQFADSYIIKLNKKK